MFEVGRIYESRDDFKQCFYLYVLEVAKSNGALFAVVYDYSYKVLARRWCRVSISHGVTSDRCVCYASGLFFRSTNFVFSTCYPPEEVINYFRNDKLSL